MATSTMRGNTTFKGGPVIEEGLPDSRPKAKTVNLTFASEAELQAYDTLKKAADDDERSVASFIVRYLRHHVLATPRPVSKSKPKSEPTPTPTPEPEPEPEPTT